MKTYECITQAELDAALQKAKTTDLIICLGNGCFEIKEQATVSASEQATVRAWGQATVSASGQATVRASEFVTVSTRGSLVSIDGGILIPNPQTAQEWCEFYGAEIDGDRVILFKAVRSDYRSTHGMSYAPGTTPSAPDWDGGKAECGGGLHFVAHPWEGLGFDIEATRFIACPVLLSEIVVHPDPTYPNKVKAPRVALPSWECDIDGKPLPVVVAP